MMYSIYSIFYWLIVLSRGANENMSTALDFHANNLFDAQKDNVVFNTMGQRHNHVADSSLGAFEWTDIISGIQGDWKDCVGGGSGYYACGAEMRSEDYHNGDENAVNGLQLKFCHYNDWNNQTEFKGVFVGKTGIWKGKKMCSENMYVDGAQVKFEGDQGSGYDIEVRHFEGNEESNDYAAINGLKIRCSTKDGKTIKWISVYDRMRGLWHPEVIKSGKFVTKAQIQFEDDLRRVSEYSIVWSGLRFVFEPMPSDISG
jgi:hypothetical protein